MRVPRWLAALPFSLVVHVVIVAAAVAVLRTESLPALILDLNAMIAGHDDGPAAGKGSPAGARPSPAPRAATVAPTRSPSRTVPAPPAALAPPEPARPAAPEPAPSARPEPMPPPAADPAPAGAPDPTAAPSPTSSSPIVPTSGADPSGTRATGQGTAGAAASTSGSGPASGSGTGRAGGGQTAAVAPGAGGVGAGMGSEYSAYYVQLRQRIQEGLRYPPMARRRGVTGTVQLEIAVAIDGGIAEVSVIGSSSHEILDRAAVDAARSVRRVPFPADVRPRPLQIRLPVVFELQ